MTLLEVVVAIALAAMLLLGLTGVFAHMLRLRRAAEQVQSDEWMYALDRVFWNDLAQASAVAQTGNDLGLVMPTNLSENNVEEIVIAYRLELSDGNTNSFVRYSYDRTTPGKRQKSTLVWKVQKVLFERIDDQGRAQPFPKEFGPPPRAFRCQIWTEDALTPIVREIIVR